MRICLVVHGFPPYELAGVETYTAGLARALGQRGHGVEVLALRSDPRFGELALRREERDGFGLTWLNSIHPARDPAEALDPPGLAEAFGDYLDRERPDLVHFQHVVKLGLGLVTQARERGLPTCLTAHDYFGVCHRFTLLRPDLERCETIGKPEVCARCDQALALLNEREELGDYQLGVLPDQLDTGSRARLTAVLAGNPDEAGFDPSSSAAAVESRTRLDRRRKEVLGQIDRVFVPTRFLLDRLLEGGFDPERTSHMPYGVEVRGLADLPGPRSGPPTTDVPLRLAFVGSLTKHKGVHVLLEAFALLEHNPELRGRFKLTLSGASTDHVYTERLQTRARELGVRMLGKFQPHELPGRLAAADVLVVPSIWVENQPLAIREAFAAGRPVITSNLGALPESVRDGTDGLLFEPGDPADLARVLGRLVHEPDLLGRLIGGIAQIKGSAQQAAELEPFYEGLIEGGREQRVAGHSEWAADLPHLAPLAGRFAELGEKPVRELFGQVLRGIERLADQLGVEASGAGRWMDQALRSSSRTQSKARDAKTEIAYLRNLDGSRAEAIESLEERVAWRESELSKRESELSERGKEARWLRENNTKAEEEAVWLRQSLDQVGAERDWLRGNLQQIETERKALQEKSAWLEGEVGHRDEELVWRRSEMERIEELERDLEELREQTERLGEWLVAVERGLDAQAHRSDTGSGPATDRGGDPQAGALGLEQLAERFSRLESGVLGVTEEVRWRRAEMENLEQALARSKARWLVLRGSVAEILDGWRAAREGQR